MRNTDRHRSRRYPRHDWTGELLSIHPRSEIKDDQNVFIAEVRMQNLDDTLRPGMNGQARITTARHALIWNLFHKPVESVLTWLGW